MANPPPEQLKRILSLPLVILYGLGITIGAGIIWASRDHHRLSLRDEREDRLRQAKDDQEVNDRHGPTLAQVELDRSGLRQFMDRKVAETLGPLRGHMNPRSVLHSTAD